MSDDKNSANAMTPTNDSGRGVLALPLSCEQLSSAVGIFDSQQEGWIALAKNADIAAAIVTACDAHAALTARVAELEQRNAELVKALREAETAVRDDATKYSVWPNGESTLLKIADGIRAALSPAQAEEVRS